MPRRLRRSIVPAVPLLLAILVTADPALAGTPLAKELVATFSSPVYVTHAPGDTERLFVVERAGRIRIFKDGAILPTPFLDITALVSTTFEGGLLGLAFHPDYAVNGRFFVDYTAPGSGGAALVSTIAAYRVQSGNPDVANPTGMTIFTVDQPAANHNAGWIGFGPDDGYLYVPFGDGGGGQDRAQDITDQLLGKIVRIDVNADAFPVDPNRNYAIPPDNPFVGVTGDDEIWALGLRNPFRSAFDRATGDLWIGDVGAGTWEEINLQPTSDIGGRNYGWGCMEGLSCNGPYCTCNDPSLTLPVHYYPHSDGCAVMGGAIYRGCAIPDLVGTYLFGDYCSGRIWSFRYEGGQQVDFTERTAELGAVGGLSGFGEDAQGELYMTSLNGSVYRIIPATPVPGACGTPGDLDGDGSVTFADLLLLLGEWGPCAPPCPADLDGDGSVTFADLLILLGNWG